MTLGTATTSDVRAPERGRPPTRRRLTGRPRRLVRAAHVTAAGAWLGLVVAMLVLGIAAHSAASPVLARSTYRAMDLVGGRVVPPLAVATLATGLLLSLLTPWGIVRHWWVVTKLVLGLVVIVTAVSLTDRWLEQALATPGPATGSGHLVALSVVHLAMLAFATVISVDKPWGRTPYGRRRAAARRSSP